MGFINTAPTTLKISIGRRGSEFMDAYHGVDERGNDMAASQDAYLPMRKLFKEVPEKVVKLKNPNEKRGRKKKVVVAANESGAAQYADLDALESVVNEVERLST